MSRIAISAFVLAVLHGLIVGPRVRAEESKISRPQWMIVVTIIDRATGQKLAQSRLTDRSLVFDDPGACNSVLAQIHPVADEYTTVVLTCRQAGSMEEAEL